MWSMWWPGWSRRVHAVTLVRATGRLTLGAVTVLRSRVERTRTGSLSGRALKSPIRMK